MWNYQAFLSELENNFGPHDPIGDAKKSLSKLVMKKTTKIMKYNMDFWELASQASWNKAALHDRYYCGLLLCLCTEVLCGGKPQTLAQLGLKAQDADNIYWMQEEEAHIESGNTGSSKKHPVRKTTKILSIPTTATATTTNPNPQTVETPLPLLRTRTLHRKTNQKTPSLTSWGKW